MLFSHFFSPKILLDKGTDSKMDVTADDDEEDDEEEEEKKVFPPKEDMESFLSKLLVCHASKFSCHLNLQFYHFSFPPLLTGS